MDSARNWSSTAGAHAPSIHRAPTRDGPAKCCALFCGRCGAKSRESLMLALPIQRAVANSASFSTVFQFRTVLVVASFASI